MYKPARLFTLPALALAGFLTSSTLTGCAQGDAANSTTVETLDRGIAAHGGMPMWNSYGVLEYDLVRGDAREHHVIDLKTRKVRITADGFTIGFDGENAWVSPNLKAFGGNPRFYSSLYFYFFAIPFVLADPGTHHFAADSRVLDGTTYDVAKVSFEDGVGDSPRDYYLPHFNHDTGRLELLLYTVTFRSQEVSEQYNAQRYESWQEVGGLMVPETLASYVWDNSADTLGTRRGAVRFANVVFRETGPDPGLFEKPVDAEVYPMKQGDPQR